MADSGKTLALSGNETSVGEWTIRAKRLLKEAEVESPSLSADLILEAVTDIPRAFLWARPETYLAKARKKKADKMLAERLKHKPMAYILGWTEFRHLRLQVGPSVLIPRPETEEMVGLARSLFPGARSILDAGTGSGCIALSLARGVPGRRVTACDISEDALEMARRNDSDGLVDCARTDWLSGFSDGSFDLIISNPPYVTDQEMGELEPGVSDYEPEVSLRGGADGCDSYRRIIRDAFDCIRTGGGLLVEGSPMVAQEVVELMRNAGFRDVQVHQDLSDRDRFISGKR